MLPEGTVGRKQYLRAQLYDSNRANGFHILITTRPSIG